MKEVSISDDRSQLLKILKDKAFFRQKIVLSSGKESDYYIDARLVTLTSQGAYLCAKVLRDMMKDERFDAIGGPTLGADPLLGALNVLSHQAGEKLNTFIIRKEPKKHGKQQQIEGPVIKDGGQVILIDDVATTGKAFVQSIEVLKKSNIIVKKACCVVDRGEGAKEALAALGCELRAVFTIKDFIQ